MHFLPLVPTNREATILRLFWSNSAGRDIVSARSRRIECHDQLGSCAKRRVSKQVAFPAHGASQLNSSRDVLRRGDKVP